MTQLNYQTLYQIMLRLQQHDLDWDRTAQALVSSVGEALGVTHGALVTLTRSQTLDRIYALAQTDDHNRSKDRSVWDALLRQGVVGHVYHSRRPRLIRNLQTDPRWPHLATPSPIILQTGAAIAVPLDDGEVVQGVLLYMHPQADYFTSEHVAWLDELARGSAALLRHAALLRDVQMPDMRYESLFEHSLVPILLTTPDGVIQDVNNRASAYLGFSRSDLQQIPIQDINIAAFADNDLSFTSDERESHLQASVFDMDGREIPTLIRVRQLELHGSPILEWVLQDLSAQMQLEQLRKDLTAMVYHDLRSPLSNILISAQKLQQLLQGNEHPAVGRILTLGLRSARQLQRMIESLLDIQRLEEHKIVLNRQPAHLEALFDEVIELVGASATDSKQTLQVTVDPDLQALQVDVDLITRVLVNLVENAIKYTPQGGAIRLLAQQRGHYLLVSVIDSGPGIPSKMRDRIFDKFSRVKYKDVPKGVGLGLAFCRLAVEAHAGHIWVDDAQPSGSAFRFTLPLYHNDDVGPSTLQD